MNCLWIKRTWMHLLYTWNFIEFQSIYFWLFKYLKKKERLNYYLSCLCKIFGSLFSYSNTNTKWRLVDRLTAAWGFRRTSSTHGCWRSLRHWCGYLPSTDWLHQKQVHCSDAGPLASSLAKGLLFTPLLSFPWRIKYKFVVVGYLYIIGHSN